MVPPRQQGWVRLIRGRLGCLAVLTAMVGQLLLGGMMTGEPARAERMALVAANLLCSSSNVPVDGHRHNHHHAADLALCPAALALASPATILSPAGASPKPAVVLVSRIFERPLLRGPPAIETHPGTSRGPPPTV